MLDLLLTLFWMMATQNLTSMDVVAQIGVPSGKIQKVKFKVNENQDQVETFETMPATVTPEILDGKVAMPFTVNTTDKVTGRMKIVDWNMYKDRWDLLKQIKFPVPENKSFVDTLIGLNYSDLHASHAEVIEKAIEPINSKGDTFGMDMC